jgi:flavin reductase ActVB
MGSFPSGVVIVTTLDGEGKPWGFTASSFSSVSLDPPLILVCPAKSAECHAVFSGAPLFAVSILRSSDEGLARRFATRGAPKFDGDEIVVGAHGLLLIRHAVATLLCRKYADYDGGDHSIIVGEVQSVNLGAANDAMVYYRRQYWRLAASLDNAFAPAPTSVAKTAVSRS